MFNEITGKVYVMELPNKKGDDGRALWRKEVKRLADKLSEVTGKQLTVERLRKAAEAFDVN